MEPRRDRSGGRGEPPSPLEPPRLVLATIAALLVVPTAYALLRAHSVIFEAEPDPARVEPSPRIALFWRLGFSAWLACALGPLAYKADFDARVVTRLVPIVALLLAFQAIFLP